MKKFVRCIGIVASMLLAVSASAQHQFDNWYFGDSCAVGFSSGAPINLPNGALHTNEGCSSISDTSGNLLFYTDGKTVYNANHAIMPNGFGLDGSGTTTQSALIVKDPANVMRYYIFTVDSQGAGNGLRYSQVDMTLQSGLGDVTTKNILLVAPTDEKLAGIRNANGTGYWILTHLTSGSYYAYPLTASGVGAPIISSVGIVNNGSGQWLGHLKFSPDGLRIANCEEGLHGVEVARFNDTTGAVSQPFMLHTPTTSGAIYAAEFSGSGKVLYVGNGAFPAVLHQFNLSPGDSTAVQASMQIIYAGDESGPVVLPGALQTAPDHKIYWAYYMQHQLGVINQPDSIGMACGFVQNGFTLNATSIFGLPNCVVNRAPKSDLTSISSPINALPITMFPNPANDVITIVANGMQRVSVYNVFGQSVYNGSANNRLALDVTNFANGVYGVTVQSKNSSRSLRLVVQHR